VVKKILQRLLAAVRELNEFEKADFWKIAATLLRLSEHPVHI